MGSKLCFKCGDLQDNDHSVCFENGGNSLDHRCGKA